ncbi:MAG: hypothetical protein LDL13_01425 [Calditerrivibrio sp.]|nr:hypothetical protein [Calditerrivibrio sp.]MCA1932223.1 hypothetical protein [Calditerrivibrio sp.]
MKMMMGLIIAGLLLLYSSFYFGMKYFDGKVEKDTYESALVYDNQMQIIKKYNIEIVDSKIYTSGSKTFVEGFIKSDKKLNLTEVRLEYPSKNSKIQQDKEIDGSSFKLLFDAEMKGNYSIVAYINIDNISVRLEKAIYIK